jgi:hypothetical protein
LRGLLLYLFQEFNIGEINLGGFAKIKKMDDDGY